LSLSPKLAGGAAATVFALTACGGSSGDGTKTASEPKQTFAAGTTMARIQQRGKIIIGVKFDQPLFGLKDSVSGKLGGFDIEIARMLAKDITGSADNVTFVEAVTKNREAFIQQGKVDAIIATYAVTDKRKAVVGFAGPYFDTGIAIMVRKDDFSIIKGADLNGKTVCTTSGARAADQLPKVAPTAKIIQFATYSECAQALKKKRVQAVVTGETILLGVVSQNKDQFKMADSYIDAEQDAIGFAKTDTAFHDFLTTFLKKIEANGEWKRAYDATIGTEKKGLGTPPKITL
jgi:glutamate transport system substrate-binding protein